MTIQAHKLPRYTRGQFYLRATNLLDKLIADHEEHTGVTSTEQFSFRAWLQELQAVEDNE